MRMFLRFKRGEDGASSIEYSFLAAMTAILAIAGIWALNQSMTDMYNEGILAKIQEANKKLK